MASEKPIPPTPPPLPPRVPQNKTPGEATAKSLPRSQSQPRSLSAAKEQASAKESDRNELYAKKRRGIPAWLLSLAMHAAIFSILLFTIQQIPRGAEVEGDREAGIVLVQQDDNDAQYLTSGDLPSDAGDNADSTRPLSESLPAADALDSDLAGLLPNASDSESTGTGLSSGLPGADGLLSGSSPNVELGGKVTTEVFGIQGTGSKFIYVFDRSASMSGFGGRPLKAAKEQLIASLRSLGETHQFQIIFYNQNPRIFNPWPNRPAKLLFGTEENIRLAERYVQSIEAAGATKHMPALQLAVGLKPDVIFFLTDAEEPRLNESDLEKIVRWNTSPSSINAIEFGAGTSYTKNNFLVQLARMNMGSHAYKDVTKLGGH